ncbi:hypothetical protein DXZ20_30630 [Leptolyngbyaceae cyanobacterium CCMR0081]|uniref:Uncharacterized protein n=1 Tax=Adonisia turfae CCMR0081 TaxID=2292702 RepID=A0A6M0RUM8_9CYAN|nr:hypothetical protein [Adonisia turfae CCMR0081]
MIKRLSKWLTVVQAPFYGTICICLIRHTGDSLKIRLPRETDFECRRQSGFSQSGLNFPSDLFGNLEQQRTAYARLAFQEKQAYLKCGF